MRTQEPLKWIERFRKSNKRGTSMMAQLCVSVYDHLQNRRSISRRKLAFYLCSQEFPVQTNHPEAGCPRYAPHARSTGARTYRTSRHSLKLSLSESQVPVLIGTTLSAARSRKSEATPRSPTSPRTANTMNEVFGCLRKVMVNDVCDVLYVNAVRSHIHRD